MQTIIAVTEPDVITQWQLTCARFFEWLQTDLFGFRWWVMLVLFLSVAFIWWKLIDKTRLTEIALNAAVVIVFVIMLDELGEELTLWDYTTDIIPLFPPITAIDISCLPMVYSLLFQYFRTWKSFLIATVLMALVFCFVFEPIFVWAGVYQMLAWKSYYGFPIYILIAVISKFFVDYIFSVPHKQNRYSSK